MFPSPFVNTSAHLELPSTLGSIILSRVFVLVRLSTDYLYCATGACWFWSLYLDDVQTRRVFSLANATFDCVSKEEKEKYTVDDQKAEAYEGYKPRNVWVCFYWHCIQPGYN